MVDRHRWTTRRSRPQAPVGSYETFSPDIQCRRPRQIQPVRKHPSLRAAFVCGSCGQPICTLCAFTRNDGSRICAACASSAAVIQSDGPRVIGQGYAAPENVHLLKCIQHPKVAAARVCRVCGAPMCATCDFSLPSGLHLCPRCVVAPPKRIARSRKVLVIMAYALAVWGTVALAGFTSGALGALLKTKPDRATVGHRSGHGHQFLRQTLEQHRLGLGGSHLERLAPGHPRPAHNPGPPDGLNRFYFMLLKIRGTPLHSSRNQYGHGPNQNPGHLGQPRQ